MTDLNLLEQKITESGLKKMYIAKRIHVSPQAFNNKLRGYREFTVREMQILSTVLNLSDKENIMIFFNKKVDNLSTKCG